MLNNMSELREYYVINKRQANRVFNATLTACVMGGIIFMQIGDQGGEQKTLAFLPKWIATAAFALGVGHQGRDQFQNVLLAVDIGEGVIVHRLFEVDTPNLAFPDLFVFVQSNQTFRVPGAAWSLCCLRNTMPS